ncbi:ABC transporter permease [Klenkia taihuensis]|uniref:Iron(III) transport system permease protein n=1 Tax=Klenkia taihuensis TaxID=1225127 RepID=A0A1I1PXP5_9ACTN|nr:iron ABC transporter permease [Klenkia taihuensis]GHE08347.1 iron ABC transporter permease [Klenkia taihuensis]SFD14691.1 iron(III) transport system permease protein [Klenkia taihuensis]
MTATLERPAPPTPAEQPRRRRRLPGPFDSVTLVIAAVLIGIVVLPLGRVLVRMFWVDGALTIDPIRRTLELPGLGGMLRDTLILVVASSVLAFVIGTTLAWLNERTNARMGLLTDALPLLPFLLPPVAGAVGWTMLLSPRAGLANSWLRDLLGLVGIDLREGPFDINSWYGLILVMAFYAVPFVFMNASAGLRNLDPALEEASRLAGASTWRTLRKVTLPATAPSLGAGFLLAIWFGIGMFSIPAIIGGPAGIDVVAVRIVELLTFTFPPQTDVAIGLSGFVVVFVGLAYWLQMRILRRGRYATLGGKGARARTLDLGRAKWPARVLVLGYVFVSTVLPVVALVLVSLNGFWTPDIRWDNLSFTAVTTAVFDDRTTLTALGNSLGLGLVGGLIGILGAAMISLYVARRRTALARGIDIAVKMPAAVSNMVIAVGILLLLAGAPLYLSGSLLILLIGYLALYLPQASIAADAAVSGVGKELPEASAVSGARPARTFGRVYLPLMVPGLVAGWALLFIRIVGDLTASAILAGTANPVVGFRILEVFTSGSFALLASLSTVLVVITATVLVVVLAYTRRMSKLGVSASVGGVK